MSDYRVSIDRKNCIGDAICTALCDNFYMDSDGKASVRNEIVPESKSGENIEAEISCPVGIIKVRKTAH
ncbi:MAG: ferredoxin [Candidatus Thermoplasmatota archaeon]|jgi:ferredoxin|nr:ferredoxin [Candidatus Thermoplasmatota archaeon]